MTDLATAFSLGAQGWGDELLAGMATTAQLAATAYACGLVLGLAGAAAKLSGAWLLRALADLYTTVVRGVPEILILFLLFYGGASLVRGLLQDLGHTGPVEVSAFLAGAIALGVVSGAYSTELFRGAILAIPRGQLEAGRAVGMGPWLRFRRILFPQMLRYALPGLGNLWLVMLKDTALVSVIGLNDLLRVGYIAMGSTRQPFTFFLAVALMFLVMTIVSMIVLHRLERWAGQGVRRA